MNAITRLLQSPANWCGLGLATVAMLFTAASYAKMSVHYPVACSSYTYVRKALDSRSNAVAAESCAYSSRITVAACAATGKS